jgi:hypothetical protein
MLPETPRGWHWPAFMLLECFSTSVTILNRFLTIWVLFTTATAAAADRSDTCPRQSE